jgi:hypothetical protein
MGFFLTRGRVLGTPEQEFWNWFEKQEDALFNFEQDQQNIFAALTVQLHKVHESLTFEFGPKEDNKREFVISADGIKDAFPKVISLYDAAPKLPHWTFIKFRPRREPMDVSYGGENVPAVEVSFVLKKEGNKVGVTLFMPRVIEQNRQAMTGIAFLLLDQALGEYDVETKVGSIEAKPINAAPPEKKPLKELSKSFDAAVAEMK